MSQDSVCISVYDAGGTNMNTWITALVQPSIDRINPLLDVFFLCRGRIQVFSQRRVGVLSCRHRGGVTTGTHSPTQSVYVLKNCKYWKLRSGSDADLFMSRTLYIELSQMKSSASESIKNDGLFQFGTAQSREPRSLKTKTSKLCWPFNSERRILCWGLYRLPSSNMLLPSPCTAFSQSLSVNSFQWRIRDERAGDALHFRMDHVTWNALAARKNEA